VVGFSAGSRGEAPDKEKICDKKSNNNNNNNVIPIAVILLE
jgi:hypothetical protein